MIPADCPCLEVRCWHGELLLGEAEYRPTSCQTTQRNHLVSLYIPSTEQGALKPDTERDHRYVSNHMSSNRLLTAVDSLKEVMFNASVQYC